MGSYDKKIDFTARSSESSPLIDNFSSYASSSEVKNRLANEGYSFVSKEQGAKVSQGRRPPFHITTLTVENYKSLNEEGVLEFVFFNDRLQQTVFQPKNIDEYWSRLTQGKEAEIKIPPYTTVRKYPDAISPPLKSSIPENIRFVDDRLQEEQKIWILRYS